MVWDLICTGFSNLQHCRQIRNNTSIAWSQHLTSKDSCNRSPQELNFINNCNDRCQQIISIIVGHSADDLNNWTQHTHTHPHTHFPTYRIIHHMIWIGLCWMVVGDWVGGGNVIALRSPSPLGPRGPWRKKCLHRETTPPPPPIHPPSSSITISTSCGVWLYKY